MVRPYIFKMNLKRLVLTGILFQLSHMTFNTFNADSQQPHRTFKADSQQPHHDLQSRFTTTAHGTFKSNSQQPHPRCGCCEFDLKGGCVSVNG